MPKPITIIGGGLAGLTLGIALRQRGVPATIWEAGGYPRHRVCGEFISGRGQMVLERLGLRTKLEQAGALYAQTALFLCGKNRSPVRRLETPALCVSRYILDALLAETYQQLGGELRSNARWAGADTDEGMVQAGGRRLQAAERSPRWFGVKAHLPRGSKVALEADLEMHLSPDGYVGINRINGGEVNVCGLFRTRETRPRPASRQDWLRGEKGSSLQDRLGQAEFDSGSFCSVAGLRLQPQRAGDKRACCIGDALTMTPPVTGNGMSMAFESAEIAAGPLANYSEARINWNEAKIQIARRCDDRFAGRLAWARRLQWLMMSEVLRGTLGGWLLRSDWLWRVMYARTR